MEHKLFLQRLSELAEWEPNKTGPNGCATKPRKKKVAVVTEDIDEEASADLDELEAKQVAKRNELLSPVIIKLKNQSKFCEDCNEVVENRVLSIRVVPYPVPHWREKCNCGIHKNPNTGEFNVTNNQELQDAFRKYLISKELDK
jgi:hypothetical protein